MNEIVDKIQLKKRLSGLEYRAEEMKIYSIDEKYKRLKGMEVKIREYEGCEGSGFCLLCL